MPNHAKTRSVFLKMPQLCTIRGNDSIILGSLRKQNAQLTLFQYLQFRGRCLKRLQSRYTFHCCCLSNQDAKQSSAAIDFIAGTCTPPGKRRWPDVSWAFWTNVVFRKPRRPCLIWVHKSIYGKFYMSSIFNIWADYIQYYDTRICYMQYVIICAPPPHTHTHITI